MTTNTSLNTTTIPNWCPGCWNFQILAAVKNVISEEIKKGKKKEDFAIVAGIGCHAKIFDYINLNGINTLHGRVLPTCLGMKVGNPNLNVIGFSGDGDAYAEGMEHLIHAARYNSNFKYFVHNNQVFALTVGQPTPTTERGYKDKTTPLGVKLHPLNPIKIMLASGASFVARVYADAKQIEYVFKEALKHKGFAFIEIIQPCLIFHPDPEYKNKFYSLEESKHDKTSFEQAWKKASEFDYDIPHTEKIATGIFYQKEKPIFEEQYSQLMDLKKKKIGWKDIKR
jgi:2-oxoglutarate ferredoxin oxidoreductase subunit beta